MFRIVEIARLSAPISLNFELTEQCNLRCTFCYCAAPDYGTHLRPDRHMTANQRKDLAMRVLDRIAQAGVLEVRLFGGEFTVAPFWREVMRRARALDLFVSFVSNGTLLSSDDVEFIAEIGVSQCSISLHGLEEVHDQITGVVGSFQKAVHTIQALQRAGIRVAVPFTPISLNLPFFESFCRTMRNEYGITGIGMNRLLPCGHSRLSLSDYRRAFDLLAKLRCEVDASVGFIDSFPRCLVSPKHWDYISNCSQGVAFGQINYQGDLKNCASLCVTLGNILEEELAVVWSRGTERFSKLTHLPHSCRFCPVFCGGGCTASRSMSQHFLPDEFIPTPAEETFLDTVVTILRMYAAKFEYRVRHAIKVTAESKPLRPDTVPKAPRWNMRKEGDAFLAMLEGRGVFRLDHQGEKILRHVDGARSIAGLALAVDLPVATVMAVLHELCIDDARGM